MPESFTSLESLKAWLSITTTDDDRLLNQLIVKASRFILSTINRPSLFKQTYLDVYDGSGSCRQMLRNWPVLSVASLAVGTQTIAAAATRGQSGYSLEPSEAAPPGRPQSLDLNGYGFVAGPGNVAVTYAAGYAVQDEARTVPATANYSLAVNAPYGSWGQDDGVTYAGGASLTAVTASPTQGQYVVGGDGVYQFSAADANAAVRISYSYIPFDIEQACVDLAAYWYSARTRIGLSSKAMGGETTSFLTRDMPAAVKSALGPYTSVLLL